MAVELFNFVGTNKIVLCIMQTIAIHFFFDDPYGTE